MLLHLLYVIAFTILAFLAVGNLIRNLMTLGVESQRGYAASRGIQSRPFRSTQHPEMLDDQGNVINEPLLVMRSLSVEDAREQLDAIYNASPSSSDESKGDV